MVTATVIAIQLVNYICPFSNQLSVSQEAELKMDIHKAII
jgi:hypothetical protein